MIMNNNIKEGMMKIMIREKNIQKVEVNTGVKAEVEAEIKVIVEIKRSMMTDIIIIMKINMDTKKEKKEDKEMTEITWIIEIEIEIEM